MIASLRFLPLKFAVIAAVNMGLEKVLHFSSYEQFPNLL